MSEDLSNNGDSPLVTADWLHEHLDHSAIRIVDTRKGDGYTTSHIAGALCLDASPFLRNDGDVIGAAEFALLMSRLGIAAGTTVIAYDDGNNLFAARLWWVLKYYGHVDVRVLDGGWDHWVAENRPCHNVVTTAVPARFEAGATAGWKVDTDTVAASLANPERVILDVRSDEEWWRVDDSGSTPPGHIPGAVHLVWSDVLDPDNRCFKPAAGLRTLFHDLGLRQDQEILVYCLGGIRAAHSVLALRNAGFGHARNYEGSWAAWSRTDQPVEPAHRSTSRPTMRGTDA